ncbi:hypothetical protein L596_011113 [Steinernema carpocapsae]|uniref:Uncharacterized protein n=1 Tax=Steinernema carpocapsae TaxID=34508 RepID=A0A4U5NSJ5_STECR|nr:hypothetical protein L596_011113 [Steinernema carpocapsae]
MRKRATTGFCKALGLRCTPGAKTHESEEEKEQGSSAARVGEASALAAEVVLRGNPLEQNCRGVNFATPEINRCISALEDSTLSLSNSRDFEEFRNFSNDKGVERRRIYEGFPASLLLRIHLSLPSRIRTLTFAERRRRTATREADAGSEARENRPLAIALSPRGIDDAVDDIRHAPHNGTREARFRATAAVVRGGRGSEPPPTTENPSLALCAFQWCEPKLADRGESRFVPLECQSFPELV